MREQYTYWLMGRVYILVLALTLLLGFVVRGSVQPVPQRPVPYPAQTVGYDVSWPNCTAHPPVDNAWGVVGVTGGLVFRENSCLSQEAAWFRTTSLYVNTGYAGLDKARAFAETPYRCAPHDEHCLAYNYGYAAGLYAVKAAFTHRLYASVWWLDVETENSWSDHADINRQSLRGTADAIKRQTVGAVVAYYSYPGQWDRITDSWRPGAPAWAATGTALRQTAIDACAAPSFTGGPVWLTQYVTALDRDYACPQSAL
jgi:hypothetical protein